LIHAPPSERMNKRRRRLIERDGCVHAFNWQNRSIQPQEAPQQACGASKSFIMIDSAIHDDVEDQRQFALDAQPDQRVLCGKPFTPRQQSGGSAQRFCASDCRLAFHKERYPSQHRGVYAGPRTFPATEQPIASRPDDSLVLMGQQHLIEVAWDRCGNLVLRQNGYGCGHSHHELRVSRDSFPRFLEALDELRQLIVDAIRRDESL
jgi:hypothetical protein